MAALLPPLHERTVPAVLEAQARHRGTTIGRVREQAMRQAGVTPDTWDREAAGVVVRRGGIAVHAKAGS